MSSSCIPAGLRLDLDMVKAAASPGAHSSPLRPAHSSPSSTLSEASNSSSSATSSSVAAAALSLKRARAPRKRPNQTYNEAAAVLASIYPSIFPVKKSPKTAPRAPRQLAGGDDDDLLPPLPVLGDAAFLLSDTPKQQEVSLPPPPQSPSTTKNCPSPAAVSSSFREFRDPAPSPASAASADEPGELDFDDDGFNADSMLDIEEAGIYGIMGNLAVESHTTTTSDDSILSSSGIHPYLRSLMVVGLAGRFELGLGSRHGRPNVNQALKRRDDDTAWWMWPAVPVKDITPAPPHAAPDTKPSAETTAPEKKKSKKKNVAKTDKVTAKGKEDVSGEQRNREGEATADAGNGDGNAETPAPTAPKARLGLKLDPEEVMKAWSDRGSMFADGGTPDSPKSSADVLAKLSDIDLFPDNGAGGGIREASVMRYKEKRRTRLFSKKIRYQVRKVNADCRPRMKGRFVRSPSLLQQALEEET